MLNRLKQRLREQLTKERLGLAGRYLRRKAIQLAGKAFIKKFGKGLQMHPFTLRLQIDIEATGRDVIDSAMMQAGGEVYKYMPDALAFMNLNGTARFAGFKSKVTESKAEEGSSLKPFCIWLDLFLEAASRAAIEEPVSVVQGQAAKYAPTLFAVLGLTDKAQFCQLAVEVLEGH